MSCFAKFTASLVLLIAFGCSKDVPSGDRIPSGLQGLWTGVSIKDKSDTKPVYVTSTTITSRISVFAGTMLFYVRGDGDESNFEFTALKDDHICEGRLVKGAEGVELNASCEQDGRTEEYAVLLTNRQSY